MLNSIIKEAKKSRPIKWFRLRFPSFFLYLVIKPLNCLRFKEEKKFFKGTLKPEVTKPSILLFTTHKCASTYTSKILKKLSDKEAYKAVDIEACLALTERPVPDFYHQKNRLDQLDQPTGFFIGPLRYFVKLEGLHKYKIILVLRDPRDVLTSYYYSKLYSHIVINRKFKKEREYYKNHTIDEFVLEMLPEIKTRYRQFIKELLPLQNCINLSYELLVTDFKSWLNKLVAFSGLNNQEVLDELLAEANFQVKKEDKFSQVRNITPGDYKNKLSSETIKILNAELKDELNALNYYVD